MNVIDKFSYIVLSHIDKENEYEFHYKMPSICIGFILFASLSKRKYVADKQLLQNNYNKWNNRFMRVDVMCLMCVMS